MNVELPSDRLSLLDGAVASARPKPGHGMLVKALENVFPDLEWRLVLSRKGWHRVGGVVDSNGNRIAEHLQKWIEDESNGDLLDLFVRYESAGLLATRMCGTTHYLTAKSGPHPWDFVQVEVDELREVTDRELFDPEEAPDTIEDLLDPENPVRVDPTQLNAAFYTLRKAWDMSDVHARMTSGSYGDSLFTLRFFDNWTACSTEDKDFCRHFVLHMTDYKDRFGETRLQATPLSTFGSGMPPLPNFADRGVELSRFLSQFDRTAGYPMAWYFCMISGVEKALKGVAHAVFEDVTGPYDYLPERDIAVLKEWMADSYIF
jgi:hypothetical protein